MSEEEAELEPARGCVNGTMMSLAMWAVIGIAVWAVVRHWPF